MIMDRDAILRAAEFVDDTLFYREGHRRIFRAIVYDLAASDGRTGTVRIGAEAPHLLLGWEWRRGDEVLDSGVLTGGERMKYWELHGTGDVGMRQRIGLPPLAAAGGR